MPACCDGTDILTEIDKKALLVNEDLADLVWEVWDGREIDDEIACTAWMIIAGTGADRSDQDLVHYQVEGDVDMKTVYLDYNVIVDIAGIPASPNQSQWGYY